LSRCRLNHGYKKFATGTICSPDADSYDMAAGHKRELRWGKKLKLHCIAINQMAKQIA